MILLLLAHATFTGNQACAPCHKAIYESYSQTPMARSSGSVAGDVPPGAFRHAASGNQYTILPNGFVNGRRLDYFIGSGAAGRSYISSSDGFLFQAPVTWYAQKGRWDMSPGYQYDRDPLWNRGVTPNCLFCHASQVRAIYGTENRYAYRPFLQDGVGCERCHGPGSEHAKGVARMVNPAKLDAARRDGVCGQCHLAGEARVEKPDKMLAMYRSGDLLADFVSYFVFEGPADPGLKATGYVEKFEQSRCKEVSGAKLWCGSCHDPHSVPSAERKVSYFSEKCLTCHDRHKDGGGGPDCIRCHMPRQPVVDGGHGVLTDHSIPRKPRQTVASPGWTLRSFLGDAGMRELGLAYAEVGLRTGDRRQQEEAIRLLSKVNPDAEVALRLADLLQRKGDMAGAAQLYESAIRQNPNSVVAMVNLGGIYGTLGHYERAIRLWRSALKRNPGLREAAVNLAIALRATGRGGEVANVESAIQRFGDRKAPPH